MLGVLGVSKLLNPMMLGDEAHAIQGSLQDVQNPLSKFSKPKLRSPSELLNVLKGHPGGERAVERIKQSRKISPKFSPFSLKFTPTKLQVGMHSLSFGAVGVSSDSAIWVKPKSWGNSGGSWVIMSIHFPHVGNYLIDIEGMVHSLGSGFEANIRLAMGGTGFYSGTPFQRWTYPHGQPTKQSFPAVYSITEGKVPTRRTLLFRVEKGSKLKFLEVSIQTI